MSKYVNFDHIIQFLSEARRGTRINNSPYMDNALLNLQQILQSDIHNPCLFETVEIGDCYNCRWRKRPQKCACCRRNLHIKDCYERRPSHDDAGKSD